MEQHIFMKKTVRLKYITLGAGRKLDYSSAIDLNLKGNTLEIKINNPDANMQTDFADFEAIAFCARSSNANLKIVLNYDALCWDGNDWGKNPIDFTKVNRIGQGNNGVEAKYCHYARFLYRAWKMNTLYEWFEIGSVNGKEVSKFGDLYETALNDNKLFFNDPSKDSGIKDGTEITENHLEKWFVLNIRKKNTKVENLLQNVSELHDQFPCGLFYGSSYDEAVHCKNRIFNTGYFDLWGHNNGKEVYLFELKKDGNNKLGIISELFFYSCLMKDFIHIVKTTEFQNHVDNKKTFYRGFKEFVEQAKNSDSVKAFFLVPDFHPFITGNNNAENNMKALLGVMNTRKDNVQFGRCWFNQGDIVGNDVAKFISILKSDWKK